MSIDLDISVRLQLRFRGAKQNVMQELENFEYGRGDEMGTGTQTTESGDRTYQVDEEVEE